MASERGWRPASAPGCDPSPPLSRHSLRAPDGDGLDSDAIRVAVATAQLFGGEAFVAAGDPGDEMDDVYFRDPGKPLGARVDLAGGNVSYRLFEHGLIAVTAATEEVRIGDIVLPPTAGEPRAYFFTGPH